MDLDRDGGHRLEDALILMLCDIYSNPLYSLISLVDTLYTYIHTYLTGPFFITFYLEKSITEVGMCAAVHYTTTLFPLICISRIFGQLTSFMPKSFVLFINVNK